MITDGMDKAKYKYPRTKITRSKEFDALNCPSLDMVATITHGYGMLLTLSEPFLPKDSSFSCEVILNSLDRLASRGVDMRVVSLHLQADNTAREVKNNTVLRLVGSLVASHRLHDCQVCNLLAGHSHEDIDVFFSGVTAYLEAHTELHCPEDFRACLTRYLADPAIRPDETDRAVEIVDKVRDWNLGSFSILLDSRQPFFLMGSLRSAGSLIFLSTKTQGKHSYPLDAIPTNWLVWVGQELPIFSALTGLET